MVVDVITCACAGYPEQILGRDITFTYSEDFRFSGRTLVNITWPRPKGMMTIIILISAVKPTL